MGWMNSSDEPDVAFESEASKDENDCLSVAGINLKTLKFEVFVQKNWIEF